MISGDRALAQGKQGAFYNTLEEFHKHWERIDIIVPKVTYNQQLTTNNLFGNVFIHSSPWPLIFQIKFIFRKGREIFRSHKFDLVTVHDFSPFYNGIGAYLLSLATRVPYVLEIMHIPGLPKAGSLKEFVYKYLTKFFISFDAQCARAVRVINQKQTKDFLIQAGVPVSKIKYIPAFYINLDIFKPESLEKKYDIVYVARLEKNKGISNLVEAVAILKKIKPDIKLLVIGQGPELENLKFKIKNLKLDNNVLLAGWLNGPEDVAHLLNQSRVFMNPSFNEGGPRVALEAMACGLPVVTTPVGLMVDIIKDGENGFLCDWEPQLMADKINKMLDGTELQERCSKAGLELVQRFERKQAIADYAEALAEISKKRLLVITQKVDVHDQLLGFFIEWLKRLGEDTSLSVLCLQEGTHDGLNVPIASLGKENGNSRLDQFFRFYLYIIGHQGEYDAVFVHMSPIWAVLGGPYWRLRGKKIVLWYTSKGVTLKLRIASWFSNVILTASKESFRLDSKKVIVTGHGIDTEFFKPTDMNPLRLRIITVGRITPIKNYEVLIQACKKLKNDGIGFDLTIVGEPALKSDYKYLDKLRIMIKEEGLLAEIKFTGRVEHQELPALYNSNNLFIHMSKTGSLDKVILEALACGITAVSSNDSARAFLPAEYIFKEDSPDDLSNKIKYTFKHHLNFRDYVIKNHNLDSLISKIVNIL